MNWNMQTIEKWLKTGQKQVSKQKEEILPEEYDNKVLDGMFGFAIADALGVPVEFHSREIMDMNPVKDMFGYGTHNQPAGTWSDDTSMAIATMDSINECECINYNDIMQKFSEWETDSKYTATGDFFDIGITTSNAIKNFKRGIIATECGEKSINSNGNGSLMRILPAVYYCYYNNVPYEEEVEIINKVSALTHGHEISKLGCKIYSDYVKEILEGKSKEEAFDDLRLYDYSNYYSPESINYYKRILDGSLKKLARSEIKSSGFIVDTLEASLWCNLTSSDYKEAVLKAVNLGDDTDTVGAITGSIAGILYGYENIPGKWREELISKEYLMHLIQKFNQTISENHTKEEKQYK